MRKQLGWILVLVTLAVSAVLLFGPLWDSALGENPMTRPPGPDMAAVLRLSLPTLAVTAMLVGAMWWPAKSGRNS